MTEKEQVQVKKEVQKQLSQTQTSWHRPTLQRLQLSLDTAMSFGSGTDGAFMTSTGP